MLVACGLNVPAPPDSAGAGRRAAVHGYGSELLGQAVVGSGKDRVRRHNLGATGAGHAPKNSDAATACCPAESRCARIWKL
jgi:hypothetical protein